MFQRAIIAVISVFLAPVGSHAQPFRNLLPGRSVGMQYAGSVGLFSVNAMLHSRTERIAFGLGAGHVPKSNGGPLGTYTFRFMYTPWKVDLHERWSLEPVQTGIFVAYSTGIDLTAQWPSYFEKGYYWWLPNFRQHIFMRTQLSYRPKDRKVQRIAAYFEVNTNDLYVYSWWPNRSSISVYDIVFFGAGVQVCLKPSSPRTPDATSWRSTFRPKAQATLQ